MESDLVILTDVDPIPPVSFTAPQQIPLFVQEWGTPAALAPVKKFRNKPAPSFSKLAARPDVVLPYSKLFHGFTHPPDAKRLIDPFPTADSLTYVRSLSLDRSLDRSLCSLSLTKAHALETIPVYEDAWIVTCVPHGISTTPEGIALLKKFNETDFYKCFMLSVLQQSCAGGWLVLPLSFFLGLNDTALRHTFLTQYTVTAVNYFEEPLLREDPCCYMSICFHKSAEDLTRQIIPWTLRGETRLFPVSAEHNWILCADIYQLAKRPEINVKRFFTRSPVSADTQVTCLVLHAIDNFKVGGRISVKYDAYKQYGSTTSKNIATLVVKGCVLTVTEQQEIAEEFTLLLEQYRVERWSLFLSPMEEKESQSRRRIPFKTAFALLEHIVSKKIDARTDKNPTLM